jgi:hypothetical protein
VNIGVDVDITIKVGSVYLNVPVIPRELTYDDGNATPVSVSVLRLGDVDFYNGVALDGISWSCFFPARYDAGYCKYPNVKKPTEYRNQLSSWKDTGAEAQVIIPAAGINKTMKITAFKWVFKGFEGDIYYDISFTEHKDIVPIQVSSGSVMVEEKRPAEPQNDVIKKGDKVKFKGGPVYYTSNDTKPTVQRGEAICKCTLTYNGKHPYHLIYTSGDRVYGWVDAANCQKL